MEEDLIMPSSKTFSIAPLNLMELGTRIKEQQDFCDLTLTAHGETLPVHKVILATKSKYFSSMLNSRFKEKTQESIDMSSSFESAEALKLVIDFLYKGSIKVESSNVEDILAAANQFLLDDLKEFCKEFLFRNLSLDSCIRTLALADMYSMTELYTLCLEVATCRFKDYLQYSDSLLETPGPFISKLLEAGALKFMNATDKRNMLLSWLEHKKEERFQECLEVLKTMKRLELLDEGLVSIIDDIHSEEDMSMEHLCDELSKRLRVDQPLTTGKHKALVSWSIQTEGASNSPFKFTGEVTLTMQLYFPKYERWYQLKQHKVTLPPKASSPRSLLGFIANIIVFQEGQRNLLLGILTKKEPKWKCVSLPNMQQPTSSLRVAVKVFDNKIFHLFLENRNDSAELVVRVFEHKNPKWVEVCRATVLPASKGMTPFSIHACVTEKVLYVLINSPKIMKFVKVSENKSNGYTIGVKSQPFFPQNSRQWQMLEGSGQIFLRNKLDTRELIYDITKDSWEVRKRNTFQTPNPTPKEIPLRDPSMTHTVDISLDFASEMIEVGRFDRAYMYSRCQGSRRLWVCASNLTSGPRMYTRQELTPPPTWANMANMQVLEVPVTILKFFELHTRVPKEAGALRPFWFGGVTMKKESIAGANSDKEDDCSCGKCGPHEGDDSYDDLDEYEDYEGELENDDGCAACDEMLRYTFMACLFDQMLAGK